MTLCKLIPRKRLSISKAKPVIKTGLAYMHETHGTLPGHVCSDCRALMRNSHCTTICACKEYPFRGSMMTDHRDGNGWRGHWLACGLWRLAYRPQKVEQLEIALED
jgi:hypothetical protein